jgi:hypothetical protein
MASFLPMAVKFMRLKDRYELSEGAFQAGHAMGNSIGVEKFRFDLPEIVATNNLHAHVNRTENGASRDSNWERIGSGSARAASTYMSIAWLR